MRDVALGHWIYLTWHLPTIALAILGTVMTIALVRQLRRNVYGHAQSALRWRLIGWSSLGVALASAIAWPYLIAAANVRVDPAGTWHVSNYLGVPLAQIPPGQLRELRGVDLGGLGLGLGHLEIRLADGSVIRSVRLSRDTLDRARRTLGYTDAMVHDSYGDQVIGLHRYDARGPQP